MACIGTALERWRGPVAPCFRTSSAGDLLLVPRLQIRYILCRPPPISTLCTVAAVKAEAVLLSV